EAQRDSSVRRSSIPKRIEHIPEAQLRFLGRNLEHIFENRLLHVRLMNTNRAAAKFPAVYNDVIMLTPHFFRIALEHRNVFRHGSRERMMTRIPTVLLFVEAQQRKIDYPKKIKPVRRN